MSLVIFENRADSGLSRSISVVTERFSQGVQLGLLRLETRSAYPFFRKTIFWLGVFWAVFPVSRVESALTGVSIIPVF